VAPAESSRNCTASGIVTAVAGGRIEVELERPPRCHGCDGACRWYGEGGSRRLTVATQRAFAIGAPVTLSVADRELLRGAAIVYGLPLAGLLGGALLGFAVWGSDLGTAAGAGTALAAALVAAWGLRARLERHARHALTVLPAN
jgi:sigma-E factor negative regulatory protein RseC